MFLQAERRPEWALPVGIYGSPSCVRLMLPSVCVWCANGGVAERGGIILSHCFLAVNYHHLLSIYSISGDILSCSV